MPATAAGLPCLYPEQTCRTAFSTSTHSKVSASSSLTVKLFWRILGDLKKIREDFKGSWLNKGQKQFKSLLNEHREAYLVILIGGGSYVWRLKKFLAEYTSMLNQCSSCRYGYPSREFFFL